MGAEHQRPLADRRRLPNHRRRSGRQRHHHQRLRLRHPGRHGKCRFGRRVGLTKTGGGTAVVNSPIYTGVTTVQAGLLSLTGALPTGNYVVSGGTLDIGALAQSIAGLQVTGGTLSGSGALTSATDYDVQGGVIGAILTGSVGLTKTSGGTVTLAGPNAYTGPTRSRPARSA